ncbi:MAG: aconitate hydratase B, partial [Halieaceae bacterium]
MLDAYRQHVAERAALGIPPTPLSPAQVSELIALLINPPDGEAVFLLELIAERVPPGVDEAAYVKAGFLSAIAKGESQCSLINRDMAIQLLGNMHGGYNIGTLIALIDDEALGEQAANQLKKTLLVFDAFHDVVELANKGSLNAQSVLQSWADG